MEVYVRAIEDADASFFTEIEFDHLNDLICFIKRSGGFQTSYGLMPFHSYQLCLGDAGAYAEIIVGKDDD